MIELNKSNVLTSNNFGLNSFLTDEKELFSPFKKCEIKFENCKKDCIKDGAEFELTHNLFEAKKIGTQKTIFAKEQTKPVIVLVESERSAVKLKIAVKEGIKSKIVLKLCSKEFLKSEILFELEKDSKLDAIILCDGVGKHFCNVETKQASNGNINLVMLDFAENVSAYNIFSQNEKQKANFDLNFLYSKTKAQKLDLNILAENYGKESGSHINVLGMLCDLAEKTFRGIIDFKRGSKKSVGAEKEFTLMLSQGAKSKSLPVLLCGEEDVMGSHGSSQGKLLEDAIFYIMSRGIDKLSAKKLLIKAKFNEVITKIFDEDTKNIVNEKIDRSVEIGTN